VTISPSGFKIRFPEFDSVLDARIQVFLDDSATEIDLTTWGDYYERGIYYLAAHLLTIATKTAGGSTTEDLGAVIRKKVGEIEIAYADPGVVGSYNAGFFQNTAYGIEYLRLCELVMPFVPGVLVIS
jgi:hypothetical protein